MTSPHRSHLAFRHFTDDAGREGIEAAGEIFPGHDGRIYLTHDVYDRASDAQARLALPQGPTEYFEIPVEAVPEHSEVEQVLSHYGQPGGGTQVWTTEPIEIEGSRWVALEE